MPCGEGFSSHFGFRRRPAGPDVRGLEHAFTLAVSGCRCPPSALYTFPCPGLGSALARRWELQGVHRLWRVPLRPFPAEGSNFQVPCVYQFHHSGAVPATGTGRCFM